MNEYLKGWLLCLLTNQIKSGFQSTSYDGLDLCQRSPKKNCRTLMGYGMVIPQIRVVGYIWNTARTYRNCSVVIAHQLTGWWLNLSKSPGVHWEHHPISMTSTDITYFNSPNTSPNEVMELVTPSKIGVSNTVKHRRSAVFRALYHHMKHVLFLYMSIGCSNTTWFKYMVLLMFEQFVSTLIIHQVTFQIYQFYGTLWARGLCNKQKGVPGSPPFHLLGHHHFPHWNCHKC